MSNEGKWLKNVNEEYKQNLKHVCKLPNALDGGEGSIWICLTCFRRWKVRYSDTVHTLIWVRRWLPWPSLPAGPIEVDLDLEEIEPYD